MEEEKKKEVHCVVRYSESSEDDGRVTVRCVVRCGDGGGEGRVDGVCPCHLCLSLFNIIVNLKKLRYSSPHTLYTSRDINNKSRGESVTSQRFCTLKRGK